MNKVADVATLAFVVGGIMVMVRPNSQGPALAKALMSGFAGIIATATGSIPSGFSSGFR